MGIVIIGAGGHGRSTLAQAIAQLTGVQCEVLETTDLIEVARNKIKKIDEETVFHIKADIESRKNTHQPWKKTKFYQR